MRVEFSDVVSIRALAYTVRMLNRTVPTACLRHLCMALICFTSLGVALPAQGDEEQVIETAKNYLRSSMVVRRDGSHNVALRALRHLRDPDLKPLLLRLSRTNHPSMRINGLLGLAELDADGMTMDLLTSVEDPAVQSEIITAAMDSDLLSLDDARRLLTWDDLNDGVKLVILLRLDRETRKTYLDFLKTAATSELLGRRGIAGLMLADLGDPQGQKILNDVNLSKSVDRDMVQAQLLTVLSNVELMNTDDWALAVSKASKDSPRLELMALREALRQGSKNARDYWYQRFSASTDAADQTRLAIIALESADKQPAILFEPLIQSQDPLLAQMGRAGAAVSSQSPDMAEQIVRMIELDHAIANAWALKYVAEEGDAQVRNVVLLGLMLTAEHGDPRGLQRRLDLAVAAAQELVEQDPAAAKQLLKPILEDRETDPMVLQALLYGLLRAEGNKAYGVLQNLKPMRDPDGRNLILILKAREPGQLNDRDIRNLGFIVQGAGTIPATFRLQAGWNYLKATGNADAALNQILEEQGAQ